MPDPLALKRSVLAQRGVKRRAEFVFPERVLTSLKRLAQAERKSVSRLVLEILEQDGRLQIAKVDFIDLRHVRRMCRAASAGAEVGRTS